MSGRIRSGPRTGGESQRFPIRLKITQLLRIQFKKHAVDFAALEAEKMRFILLELKGAEGVSARAVIDAATRAGIAPATLAWARQGLGLRSEKKRSGWLWTRPYDHRN